MTKIKEIINTLFFKKTENTKIQFLRYFFVGGFAFVIDCGLLILLTEVYFMHYLKSAIFAFIAGLLTNYFLSIKFVFSYRKVSRKYVEFLIFSLIGIFCLLVNELILYVATDLVGLHYVVSKIISAIIVFMLNFFIRKILLFTKKGAK